MERGRKLNPNIRSRRENPSNIMGWLAPRRQERSEEMKYGKTLDYTSLQGANDSKNLTNTKKAKKHKSSARADNS